MSELINVGVADLKVTGNPEVLASFGLGSCVAVAMFDPLKGVAGLAHVMLPESRGKDSESVPGKFADAAVQRLVERMVRKGARKAGIRCKIIGGAQMFEIPGLLKGKELSASNHSPVNIGARNVEAVKKALEETGVQLIGEDTGGNYGRTVKFDTSTGEVEVTSINHGRTVL